MSAYDQDRRVQEEGEGKEEEDEDEDEEEDEEEDEKEEGEEAYYCRILYQIGEITQTRDRCCGARRRRVQRGRRRILALIYY